MHEVNFMRDSTKKAQVMALTTLDLNRIANLARLEISPEKQSPLLAQLNDFFQIVEQIRKIDTTGILPLSHPLAVSLPVALRLQPDVVSEDNQRVANQRSAPHVEDGLFLVPKVMD